MTEERRSVNLLLAQFLRETRNAQRLRQEDVAREIRSDTDTIGRYERAEESPRIDWLQRWADFMRLTAVERRRMDEVYLVKDEEPFATEERLFMEELAKPSLVFGGVELNTKLVPTFLWDAARQEHLYIDDQEEEGRKDGRRIKLEWTNARLPANLLSTIMREMEDEQKKWGEGKSTLPVKQFQSLDDAYTRIKTRFSNRYCRAIAIPDIVENEKGRLFRIQLGEGTYGVSLAEERKLPLSSVLENRTKHILLSLALRVAYVFKEQRDDAYYWMEFHQRREGTNATWPLAWDVGAAGYFDPDNHTDPDEPTRVSPWQGCADEIAKELGIPKFALPHRDHYFFFGLANDQPTGHIILIGYCKDGYPPAPNRERMALVRDYDRCRLTPEEVANFLLRKHKWVPAALLTSILTLEAFGYERGRIEQAFSCLAGQLDLSHE
jgi:transcriptional regulator with XRE-family HTH domain